MTPPVLYELLLNLDEFLFANIRLIETDPDEFYYRLEQFICFVVSRSFREGVRLVMKNVTEISEN